jgi:oligoribonuclease
MNGAKFITALAEKVLQSDISENDAEKQVLDFIRKYIGSATPLIAGNSVYMDLLFLKVSKRKHTLNLS